MTPITIIQLLGGVLSGLLAGLFFDFSVAIVPGLRSLGAKQHLEVMQAINVKIKNPVFLLSFMGPTILLPLAAVLERDTVRFPLLIAASALHIIGVNAVTLFGNVPINDRLESVNLNTLSDAEAVRLREDFHGQNANWMRLHTIRTGASILVTLLVFLSAAQTR